MYPIYYYTHTYVLHPPKMAGGFGDAAESLGDAFEGLF